MSMKGTFFVLIQSKLWLGCLGYFNRINHEGFKAYLQGKLEKYALIWLKHTNLIFKSISGFAGSVSIASFIKETIELDIDEKYLEDSKIHKDKIIDILFIDLNISNKFHLAFLTHINLQLITKEYILFTFAFILPIK